MLSAVKLFLVIIDITVRKAIRIALMAHIAKRMGPKMKAAIMAWILASRLATRNYF